jgi:hypothetical protein
LVDLEFREHPRKLTAILKLLASRLQATVPKKKLSSKKRRTREHIIADLSVNFVERQALLTGFSVERIVHDYGMDLVLYTYSDQGEVEPGEIYLQLKATEQAQDLE